MSHSISKKEFNSDIRNIFFNTVVPVLEKQGFEKSPFTSDTWGWNSTSYWYTLVRLRGGFLERITTVIQSDYGWIEMRLQVFRLSPTPKSLSELQGQCGHRFSPFYGKNSSSLVLDTDLRTKDRWIYRFTDPRLILSRSFSRKKYERRKHELERFLEQDLQNIDSKIAAWHKRCVAVTTDWNGKWLDEELEAKKNPALPGYPVFHEIVLDQNNDSLSSNIAETHKTFDSCSAAARRKASKAYGFKQAQSINWKIENGYYIYIETYQLKSILNIKPDYADALWCDICEKESLRRLPNSFRADSYEGYPGAVELCHYNYDYDFFNHPELLPQLWQKVFHQVEIDLSEFMQKYPNADMFVPEGGFKTQAKKLYLLTLIHQKRYRETLRAIRQARRKKAGSDGWLYIRLWCYTHMTGNFIASVFRKSKKGFR